MTTPLHSALGRTDANLTLELVQEACRQGVVETEQLDWKLELPLRVGRPGNDHESRERALELAKDLAAMANGRGGLIVYGVREEGGGRAGEITGVDDLNNGEMSRRIRQVAYNFVYPPLQVDCHTLSGDSLQVLVVEVREGENAPHLVQPRRDGGNEGWFVAPYRSGPDTQNMLEKQIESAYRQRMEGRRQRESRLRELHQELQMRRVTDQDRDTGTVVALAQPVYPRRGALPGPRPEQTALSIVNGAAWLSRYVCSHRKSWEPPTLPPNFSAEVRHSDVPFVATSSRPANRSGTPMPDRLAGQQRCAWNYMTTAPSGSPGGEVEHSGSATTRKRRHQPHAWRSGIWT